MKAIFIELKCCGILTEFKKKTLLYTLFPVNSHFDSILNYYFRYMYMQHLNILYKDISFELLVTQEHFFLLYNVPQSLLVLLLNSTWVG